MVQHSAILLAAMALGVAPALAAPLTWESNELEARAVADSFGSNYGPPPPSHGRPQRRDIQDRAQIFSRDLDEVGLFARKDHEGDGRKDGKEHRGDDKHRKGDKRRKGKKHDKRSVFARADPTQPIHHGHHHHRHHRHPQGGPPPGGSLDGPSGGLPPAPDASAMGAMGATGPPARRAVDDYTQLFTRDFDEDVELFARAPHEPHHPHPQMNSQGGLPPADGSGMPTGPIPGAPPGRRDVDEFLFGREIDELD